MNLLRGFVLLIIFIPRIALGQTDTIQKIVPGRSNSVEQQKQKYVILISADGFRYDYATKYNATNLLKLSAKGVAAEYMVPSFPSLTFPNHYSLVTGMYPSHHGLVDNSFYDPGKKSVYSMSDKKKVSDKSWYGGVPLWVLAEQQKMLSASFYWVGSEAPIMDLNPTYYYAYNELITMNKRIASVRKWLTLPPEQRPHLITFYFPEVDHAGHYHEPNSPETEAAVHLIDKTIGQMVAITDSLKLPVDYVFVSDHGMIKSDTTDMIKVPAVLTDTSLCKWTGGSTMLMVYCKSKQACGSIYDKLKASAEGYDVNLSENTPASWHFSRKDDAYHRIGDIILTSRAPKIFKVGKSKPYIGKHGYDPLVVKEMRATFMAWGPDIKKSPPLGPFENVNVYPLVTKLLGLKYDQLIDGDPKVLNKILK